MRLSMLIVQMDVPSMLTPLRRNTNFEISYKTLYAKT